MATWKDQYRNNPDWDSNYCIRQWVQFTTLTNEEFENLKKIMPKRKAEIDSKALIYCPELDITARTMKEMSALTGVSYTTIFKRLHGKTKPQKVKINFRRLFT